MIEHECRGCYKPERKQGCGPARPAVFARSFLPPRPNLPGADVMSLSGVFASANAGLQAAQAQLRAVSDNVANVDTKGYVRKTVDQTAPGNGGAGVHVGAVQNAADRFLQATSLHGTAQAARAGAVAGTLDQAQQLFGDPTSSSSLFGALDGVFGAFTALNASPSAAGAAQAVGATQRFFGQASSVAAGLTQLSNQADQKLAGDVATANGLLQQIDALNGSIATAQASGGDATDLQDNQSGLVDQLAGLIDVKVSPLAGGGVGVRTAEGTALAGNGAATLAYDGSGATGVLTVTPAGGQPRDLSPVLQGGEIKGLLDLRNTGLPAVQGALADLEAATADALNAAHNAYSAVPAPATLGGRNTGQDAATAVAGFTGRTTVAIVDGSGALVRQAAIDFDAGTITAGGVATRFTPQSFVSTLNTALSPAGGASFGDGALNLTASGGDGVAVAVDPAAPGAKAGQGFSDFFGLNDLVGSSVPSDYATGLTAASPGNYTGSLTVRLTAADGTAIRDATVSLPAGGSVGDLLGALNDPAQGVGLYGSFALDSQGRLAFSPAANSGVSLSVARDATVSATGGASLSARFGIGAAAQAARAGTFSARADIAANPAKLALAKLNLSAASGTPALASGDVSGADALSQAGRSVTAPGGASVSDYAASIAASIARQASDADQAKTSAQAVSAAADARRSSGEGVNLDDELVKLTTYQQAYSASARLVQAAKDVFDALLNVT